MTDARDAHVAAALDILTRLGLPKAQLNERSSLCLLALVDLVPGRAWRDATAPLLGITPMMEWMRMHYDKDYAPNTRETVRRQTIHPFCDAGLVRPNPEQPNRPTNSPRVVYQVEGAALELLRSYGTPQWAERLEAWLSCRGTLVATYAQQRERHRVDVVIAPGKELHLSPGAHSALIRAVIEEFAPRFVPASELVYVGDTGHKWSYLDQGLLDELGIEVDPHGKMPDVVLYFRQRGWLVLAEAVTSHGPVDGKRREELKRLFSSARAGLVFVSAFPERRVMQRYLALIAWETEVWVADAPSHLIHFNGDRFLGPHPIS